MYISEANVATVASGDPSVVNCILRNTPSYRDEPNESPVTDTTLSLHDSDESESVELTDAESLESRLQRLHTLSPSEQRDVVLKIFEDLIEVSQSLLSSETMMCDPTPRQRRMQERFQKFLVALIDRYDQPRYQPTEMHPLWSIWFSVIKRETLVSQFVSIVSATTIPSYLEEFGDED